ncbi:hypothetical protein EAI_00352 [Harpegnathos saltator]|uniref:Uncharacterized protein n=1 Tax=Harpegnathos saltator TaxID=610380 RepID=E2BSH5_HARSA|nr:hypothetical protein EAI_00352 [Harpegnathos saltator]
MEFGGYKGTGPRVRVRRRAELGRRLTRRLSIVAKMPAAILSRANPPEPRPVEITAIAPDKTQLTVSESHCFSFIESSCPAISAVSSMTGVARFVNCNDLRRNLGIEIVGEEVTRFARGNTRKDCTCMQMLKQLNYSIRTIL